jgi:hypothetical protein
MWYSSQAMDQDEASLDKAIEHIDAHFRAILEVIDELNREISALQSLLLRKGVFSSAELEEALKLTDRLGPVQAPETLDCPLKAHNPPKKILQ